MNPRVVGATVSVLLHASLLVNVPAMPPPPPSVQTTIRQEDGDMQARLLPAASYGDGLACAGKYRGIGAVTNWSGYVREVVAGGPADLAGMRVGDRFLNDGMFVRDFYDIDRALELVVERDGKQLRLPVRIGRICYEGKL